MHKAIHDAATLAAAGAGVLRKAGSAVLRPGAGGDDADDRWLTVTINRAPQVVAPGGRLPEPLTRLGDRLETSIRPAPGDKGTELAARWKAPRPPGSSDTVTRFDGDEPRQEIRSALRQAKQLLEVGEVLSVDGQPAGDRSPTPAGRLVETFAKRADKEGLV